MVQKQNGRAKVQNGRTGQDGFTLAELLIVMVIMGILAAMAIPRFADQVEIARENVDISNLRNAYTAVRSMMMVKQFKDGEVYYYDINSGSLVSADEIANSYQDGYMRGERFGKAALVDTNELPENISYDITQFSSDSEDPEDSSDTKWNLPSGSDSGYVIQVNFEQDYFGEIISNIGFIKTPKSTATPKDKDESAQGDQTTNP